MLAASAGSTAVQHLLNKQAQKRQMQQQAKLNAGAKLEGALGGNGQAGQAQSNIPLQTALINDPAVKSLLEQMFAKAATPDPAANVKRLLSGFGGSMQGGFGVKL